MKIGIMGAGAVGCYYGAMLAKASHGVSLVGRPALVERVRASGLLLETSGSRHAVPAQADTDPSALADCDVILCCVKSFDTEEAGRAMAPNLKADAVVFCFQNGIDNADRLEAVLARPVIPAAVYVAAEIVAPGHVRHHGRGDIAIGSSPSSQAMAEMFVRAGVPATVSETVVEALWAKLIVNCAYNALSAVSGAPYGAMMRVDGVSKVMEDVFEECRAVCRILRIGLPEHLLDTVLGLAATMPDQYSSTAQDLKRGRPTEIDHLNGYVVRKGEELGIPTPANRALQVMVKLLETSPEVARRRAGHAEE
ncbi:2-dehydropantoate 2-reductase [Labrys miyagiensis]